MATTSQKRPVRAKKTGGSPVPMGPRGGAPCGHSGCDHTCKVRYCGPTSPLHNHHIVHAARGATHIWTAAIVAGLAVVLTGAIAYTAVRAEEQQNDPTMLMLLALRRIEMRLDRIEPKINSLLEMQKLAVTSTSQSVTSTSQNATSSSQGASTSSAEGE